MPRRLTGVAVAGASVLGVGAVIAAVLVSGGRTRTYVVASPGAPTEATTATTFHPSSTSTATTPERATSAPTTTLPATTLPQPAAPVLAAAIPSTSDLGAGWFTVSSLASVPGAPSSWGPCGAQPWSADVGAAAMDVAFNDGTGQANAVITFFSASSAAAIAQQRSFTASPKVGPCLQSSASQDAHRYVWVGTQDPSQFTVAAAPVVLREPGDAELLTITAGLWPARHAAYWMYTHEYAGRYEAATAVTWCSCGPPPLGALQHFHDAVGAHLAALAAKSP
ncbi:MAG TPA: hypothetical protein VMU14_03140 [Acidimicrobiales bacterium]|nr:hypothetical protein [Acidimicrobiales bacterium]